jgi:ribosomal protein L16 Arg81 hydroxylase
MNIQLSPDETLVLAAILALLSERAKRPLSLQKLLDRWSRVVAQVEQGYEYSIYEYTNDLSVRDLLEEILSETPQALRGKLAQAIQVWDDRFLEATRRVEKPLASTATCDLSHWWFRIPKSLEEELSEDLQAEGII